MRIAGVLAQSTVRDLATSVDWYERLFARPPDARPMEGLVKWHFGDGRGLQVWCEPARAGSCTVVLEVADLDAFADRITRAGITTDAPEQASTSRILPLLDPDGNRVVLAGS